jgi:plasmid stabilization system protein ParE
MSYSFHPDARDEFERAIEYYEECEAGLGLDFAGEVHDAIQRIVDYPEAWAEAAPGIRRCLARRFPYGVLYAVHEDRIVILAVMHLRRRPGYWRDRAE